MLLHSIFFLLPFFLYIGIAAQGAAFYLLCILIPSLVYILNSKKIPKWFMTCALCLIALHIVFPIVNFINYFFPSQIFSDFTYKIEFKWPGILQSNFPSSLIFGGLATIIFVKISQRYKAKKQKDKQELLQPLKYFVLGLLPASALFTICLFIQHYTGIDLKKPSEILPDSEILMNGFFRVTGFYGHPLTVAGACLAYATFSWGIFWQFIATKTKSSYHFLPFYKKKYLPHISLIAITLFNTIAVFLSSGRTATVACILMLIVIPIVIGIPKKTFVSITTIIVVLFLSFVVAQRYGVLERIGNVTSSITANHSFDKGNNRQYFWKVYTTMFLDKPIVGQGSYWLKAGVRERYYNKLGYNDLPEKFNAHNNYLETLACGGLFAAVWIIISLLILIRTILREIKIHKPALYFLPFVFFAMLAVNFIHALTQNVFFDSSVVYIYLGILFVTMWQLAEMKQKE